MTTTTYSNLKKYRTLIDVIGDSDVFNYAEYAYKTGVPIDLLLASLRFGIECGFIEDEGSCEFSVNRESLLPSYVRDTPLDRAVEAIDDEAKVILKYVYDNPDCTKEKILSLGRSFRRSRYETALDNLTAVKLLSVSSARVRANVEKEMLELIMFVYEKGKIS